MDDHLSLEHAQQVLRLLALDDAHLKKKEKGKFIYKKRNGNKTLQNISDTLVCVAFHCCELICRLVSRVTWTGRPPYFWSRFVACKAEAPRSSWELCKPCNSEKNQRTGQNRSFSHSLSFKENFPIPLTQIDTTMATLTTLYLAQCHLETPTYMGVYKATR